MSADVIDLRPIFEREYPDAREHAARLADHNLYTAVERYKSLFGGAITAARLKQIAAGIEYFERPEEAQ